MCIDVSPPQEFSNHDNVILLLDVVKACNDLDIYLVFEFMDTDLHAVIKAGILKPVHIQYIMYQVMCNKQQAVYVHDRPSTSTCTCAHRQEYS